MKIGTTPIVSVKSGTTPIQKVYSGVNLIWSSVDPDAQAFITAASITDPTQQSAINQLVTDLKGYGVWTKMKALYPFVGGTASSHKFNLKDPRDLDAAFRLVFFGGVTHNSNGVTGNGTNGYFNTFVNPSINLQLNNTSVWAYSRTQLARDSDILLATVDGSTNAILLNPRNATNNSGSRLHSSNIVNTSSTDSTGLFGLSRTTSANYNVFIRNVKTLASQVSTSLQNNNIQGFYVNGGLYSQRNIAFSAIGDGLTDTEAANFYTAVQTFQVTIGRSIGTQTVSDADAQAFVTNAGIVDQVEADAVNNLVIGLKADGLWSKMKALYPFVGSSASSHKYNLRNPLDTDAAFRLVFNGGWTHSATGALPNGTNAYADTFLTPSIHSTLDSQSLGYYSGSNLSETSADPINMGAVVNALTATFVLKSNTNLRSRLNGTLIDYSTSTMRGFFSSSKQSLTLTDIYLNGLQVSTGNSGGALPNLKCLLGTISLSTGAFIAGCVKNDFRFAYLSDGLNDTEMSNFYTAVQAFQTTLNRQV